MGSGEQRSLHFSSSRGATNPVIMALLSAFQALAGKMVRKNVMTPNQEQWDKVSWVVHRRKDERVFPRRMSVSLKVEQAIDVSQTRGATHGLHLSCRESAITGIWRVVFA